MSIPLVQEATKDAINTSIIAIKRNIERINMLLGLSNSEEIDTSKFATKDELQQAVTDLQPVDEVAIDNMHSVSSNAVAKACTKFPDYARGNLLTASVTSYTCPEDVFISYFFTAPNGGNNYKLFIDNNDVCGQDTSGAIGVSFYSFCGYAKKGSVITFYNNIALIPSVLKIYGLIA